MAPNQTEASPLLPPSDGNGVVAAECVGYELTAGEDPVRDAAKIEIARGEDEGDDDDDANDVRDDAIRESPRSWLRLLLFFAAATWSGGIMPGQNVYSRLFCEAGLFAYACSDSAGGGDDGAGALDGAADAPGDDDVCCPAQWLLLANVMNALSCLMAFFFLLAGLVFDAVGGRWTSVMGCVVNGAGFVVVAALTGLVGRVPPGVETAAFVAGVLLVDVGSMLSNISFYGFLWHLPKQQALILSLSNCVIQVAAFVPLGLKAVLDGTSLRLGPALFLYALSILFLTTPACWISVPSVGEYRRRAMEVLRIPIPARSIKGWKGAQDLVRKATRILLHHARLHCFTIIVSVLAWMAPFIYMTMSDPMAQEIFEDQEAGERLGGMYNNINGWMGLTVGPLLGVAVDRFRRPYKGVESLGFGIIATLLVVSILCPKPSWKIQRVDIVSMSFCQLAMTLFLTRYAIIFAPADRVGSVTGLFISGLGVLSFLPIIASSIYIAVHGSYVTPERFICAVGAVAWIVYLSYVKKTNPWPAHPVLLPEDERKIAKMYGVGSIEDAAYVSGRGVEAFRRMSSSSKVEDQRALLDAAFTGEAARRVMEVARRRSSVGSTQSMEEIRGSFQRRRSSLQAVPSEPDEVDDPPPQYLIVDDCSAGPENGMIRRGTSETSLDCVLVAFNGHGGFGGRGEPSLQWVMEPLGEPDNPTRIAVFQSLFAPMVACAELVGTLLEMRVLDEDGSEATAAVCGVYHPGSLENGTIMQAGSDRYYFSLTASNEVPIYMDRQVCGEKMMQRFVGLKQDSEWDTKRKEYMAKTPIWYIGCLGTHPKFQGRGLAKRLLAVVAEWARRDEADCYLECSEENVPFYEKCGYNNIWRSDIEVDGTGTSMFGMALS